MGPSELALRLRKKFFEFSDSNPTKWPELNLEPSAYPELPSVFKAADSLREAVKNDASRISSGKIRFFGHLDIKVDSAVFVFVRRQIYLLKMTKTGDFC